MIRTLARSLREYKRGSALTIFLSILEAAFEILIPLCMAEVIDKGVDLGNMSNVWKYGIALLIFAAFGAHCCQNLCWIFCQSTTRYVR